MGRTVPTFTNSIDNELVSWSKFRRGLRKEDQELFDDLFRAPKKHLAENFYAMRAIPFESIIISIVLEQHRLIKHLEHRLAEQEQPAPPASLPENTRRSPEQEESHDISRLAV